MEEVRRPAQSRIAELLQAEAGTRLAERELEQWRSNRGSLLDRYKSPEYPRTPSSDSLQKRYTDFLCSPSSQSPIDRTTTLRSTAVSTHSNCVTRLEHELKVKELEDRHSQELESLKAKLTSDCSARMKEFEDNCLEQYRAKVKALESTHVSTADVIELQAKLEALTMNEEIITRKYEGKLARMEITLQENQLRLKKEIERSAELSEALEGKNREVRETVERAQRWREDDSLKEALEQERRNRERLAGDYKRVAIELAEEKLRNKREFEGDAKRQLRSLQSQNDQLTLALKESEKAFAAAQATIKSLKRSESVDRKQSEPTFERGKKRLSADTEHVEDLRSFYEKKLMCISEELIQWKNKSINLVTRFYPVLKQLKSDSREMREEVKCTRSRMEEELKKAVDSVHTRSKSAANKPKRDISRKREAK